MSVPIQLRPFTQHRKNETGGTVMTVKVHCPDCGWVLGDLSQHEGELLANGDPLPNLALQCPWCLTFGGAA